MLYFSLPNVTIDEKIEIIPGTPNETVIKYISQFFRRIYTVLFIECEKFNESMSEESLLEELAVKKSFFASTFGPSCNLLCKCLSNDYNNKVGDLCRRIMSEKDRLIEYTESIDEKSYSKDIALRFREEHDKRIKNITSLFSDIIGLMRDKTEESQPLHRKYRRASERPRPDLPPNASSNRNSEQTNLRVSAEFHARIKAAAAVRGMTKTEFMIQAIEAAMDEDPALDEVDVNERTPKKRVITGLTNG